MSITPLPQPVYPTPIDRADNLKLASPHAIGSGTFTFSPSDAALLGSPTTSAPVRLTVKRRSDSAYSQYLLTGRSGNVFTCVEEDPFTDLAFAANDVAGVLVDAKTVIELHDGIHTTIAKVNELVATDPVPGPKGDAGDTGPAGPKGDQGDTGPAGATGPKGDQGEPGEAGPAGPKGDTGDKGDSGDVGPIGPKGDRGDTGSTGATGAKGDTGDAGPTGPAGPAGPKGDTGNTGPTGPSGVVTATSPLAYDAGSQTISLSTTGDIVANSFSATKGHPNSEHFGLGANSPASGAGCNTAIGYQAEAGSYNTTNTFAENTCIGYQARSGHNTNTLIGCRVTATLGNNTIIGCGNSSETFYACIVGDGSVTSNSGIGSIGSGNFSRHPGAFCMGWGNDSIKPYELVWGSRQFANVTPSIRLSGSTFQYNTAYHFSLDTEWVDSTDATRKSRTTFSSWDWAGKREAIRIEGDGTQAKDGFLGAPAVAKAAAPTTLEEAITILRNLGFCS